MFFETEPDAASETIEETCPACGVTSRYPVDKKGQIIECAACSSRVAIGVPVAVLLKKRSEPTINLEPAGIEARKPRTATKKSSLPMILRSLGGVTLLAAGGVTAAVMISSTDSQPTETTTVKSTEAAVTTPNQEKEDETDIPAVPMPAPIIPQVPIASEVPKKPLIAGATEIKKFGEMPKVVPPKEKNYVPVPPPPKEAVKPAAPTNRPSPTPKEPEKPKLSRVSVPLLIPKPGKKIIAGKSLKDLLDYEINLDTLKGKKLINDGFAFDITVPTPVKFDGDVLDTNFRVVRPTEGRYINLFMVVRIANITMPE